MPIGPKKALFDDDTFVMKRTLKPLHEVYTNIYINYKSNDNQCI